MIKNQFADIVVGSVERLVEIVLDKVRDFFDGSSLLGLVEACDGNRWSHIGLVAENCRAGGWSACNCGLKKG